jgi:radical SAM protein with 4Fe4S-binding SPASM domain
MKAKVTPRINWKESPRTDLCKSIPLETPIHVFIDPSAACNFSCEFCFNRDKTKSFHDIMKMDLFNKIADDLTQFPQKLKTIKMYGFGEPLLNKNFPDMISTLKKLNVSDRIETTTNGWWLNSDKIDQIISSGLDRIVISVDGLSSIQFKQITGAKVDFEKYVENIKYLYDHRENCIVHIKTTNEISDGCKDHFFNTFGDICDEISIDNVVPLWHEIESEVKPIKNIYNGEILPVETCPYIFYHMTIHANGLVSSCFVDWERKNIIGDVNNKSLIAIWKGSQLKHMRQDHLLGQRSKYEICKNCKQLVYGQPDNIDNCAIKIFERMML